MLLKVVKYFKERRRQRRHRLPKSSLKEIAIHKFKKNDPYEMCAICLDEYIENDKLRVLPCSHGKYKGLMIEPKNAWVNDWSLLHLYLTHDRNYQLSFYK